MHNTANGNDGVRNADSLGYRGKIGVLVPATNTIAQPEYEAMKPHGVTNHVARMEPSARGANIGDMDAYRKSLERGPEHIKAAMNGVLPCEPDIILLGHSIDTFRGGLRGAAELEAELVEHGRGTPVSLPSHAFVAALDALKIGKRIAALTPYFPPGDEQVVEFFTDAGYDVRAVIGLKCPGPLAIAATPREEVIEALRQLAAEDVDAIIQPGTNLATAALSAEAAHWLGKPVISCNTASYWHALRAIGVRDRREGFGTLFSHC